MQKKGLMTKNQVGVNTKLSELYRLKYDKWVIELTIQMGCCNSIIPQKSIGAKTAYLIMNKTFKSRILNHLSLFGFFWFPWLSKSALSPVPP